jgi:hypothetical protein
VKKDYAIAESVDTATLMTQVSMIMRMTMYVHAVMVQGVLGVRSN